MLSVSQIKEFIRKQLPAFNISFNASRIGVITFSDVANVLLTLPQGTSEQYVLDALKKIHLSLKNPNLSAAFEKLSDVSFRTNAVKIVILITASSSNNVETEKIQSAVQKLKNINSKFIVVGIGNSFRKDELLLLATDDSYTTFIEDELNIDEQISKISTAIAKSTGKIEDILSMKCEFQVSYVF